MAQQAAFSGSVRGLRTLADGTVRVTVDLDSESARDALQALYEVGTAVALAVLGGEASKPAAYQAAKKGGGLSNNCAMYCRDITFQKWFAEHLNVPPWASNAQFVNWLRDFLDVESRSELDTNAEAAERWVALRKQYHEETEGSGCEIC